MVAQIGWIDFSEKDRKKALDVIHLLQEKGAVDELGIGTIRDAFANYFFPGTSTVQTRAKYFFIIPYVMKEVCADNRFSTIERIIRAVDYAEKDCAQKMIDNGDNDGVIGRDVLPNNNWVERKPSNIYWNGLKKMGIFTYPNLSATEYYREELRRRQFGVSEYGNHSGEENEQDDKVNNGLRPFWNLPHEYASHPNWKDCLTIELLPWEAKWLRKCISDNLIGSLFKHVVDRNIDVEKLQKEEDSFKALKDMVYNDVNFDMQEMLTLACRFNSLVYLSRILYNIILSDEHNAEANGLWKTQQYRILQDVKDLKLDLLFSKLGTTDSKVRLFLREMQKYLLDGKIEEAKQCIMKREKDLKGEKRAKLMRKNDFNNNAWVGGKLLDFRFGSATRLIKDIYQAER